MGDLSFPVAAGVLGGGALADLGSTEYALHQRPVGGSFVEGNPLGDDLARRIALKAALTAGGGIAIHKLSRDHRGLARALLLGLTAAQLGFAGHNLYEANKRR